jgi:hypothetical protein
MRKAISAVSIVLVVLAAEPNPKQEGLEQEVVRGIDHAQEVREQCLEGYSVTERYVLTNSHFDQQAEMVVKAEYHKGTGKTYQVVSRSGPSLLKGRVFDSILRGEMDMSRGEVRSRALIVSQNYTIHLVAEDTLNGRRCYVVTLDPKHRSPHMVKGRAWVSADEYWVMRIEGRLAASPSFWTGRPVIVREYAPIGGFWFAQKSQVHSEGFFAGKTSFSEEYSDYKIVNSPPAEDANAKNSTNNVCTALVVKSH